jgi:outer membrane receptor protein involved in Fe transport
MGCFALGPSAAITVAAIAAVSFLPASAQEVLSSAALSPSGPTAPQASSAAAKKKEAQATSLSEVTVTANRLDLLGTAQTASDGVVTQEELNLTPAYRPGQLLETVPGLIVTAHSGEGKANQYLMRGYNLDHGTDLATFIDGVPINQVTHAHGQGFTDLNVLIPELAGGLSYTKGTYHADVGDLGAVGSIHLNYIDSIPDQVSVTSGVYSFQRLFAGGTQPVAGGKLLMAIELQHYDGPFLVSDDQRKENVFLRYTHGDDVQGYSLTGSFYHGLSTNTTDIPVRAIVEGLVPNRYGSLDGSDGVRANRGILSYQYHDVLGDGQFTANAYYSHNELHLYNNFTHFLVDTVNGDQENQFEYRNTLGGEARYALPVRMLSFDNELLLGALTRGDELEVGRTPSVDRVPLTSSQVPNDPASFSNRDQVELLSTAAYVELTTHWAPEFRSVFGLRDDYTRGSDDDQLSSLHESTTNGNVPYTNSGNARRNLPQPKGSLIYTPASYAEFYISGGRGFHSADIRGVNQTRSLDLNLPGTRLLASQEGEEIGMRAAVRKNLTFTLAFYNLDQSSETIIDPDVGADAAGPPSRRSGYELNVTYKIRRWLEFYGSYSGDHTRFKQAFDDGTGHSGTHITDAPLATGSLALYLVNLGPWSGGLEYRYLGEYPLSSGACDDSALAHDFPSSFPNSGTPATCANAVAKGLTTSGQLGAKGFGELNLDATYKFGGGWSATVLAYNLLNTKANAAAFTYVDRLQSEISTFPDGRADTHIHPLEDIAARLTLTKRFGMF